MNKIQTAAALLRERAKNSTDAAAFAVKVSKDANRITLTADIKRRGTGYGTLDTFYHSEDLMNICKTLGLFYWISARIETDKNGIQVPAFQVDIYSYDRK